MRLLSFIRQFAKHDCFSILEKRVNSKTVRWLAKLPASNTDGSEGERLSRALIALGPGYIKLGQVFSTRADLLGEELAHELTALQDQLPAFDSDAASKIIVSDLDRPLDHVFKEFDPTPISAASVAQVHFATTTDGKKVAVKILRPNIENIFAKDIRSIKRLYFFVKCFTFRRLKRFRINDIIKEYEKQINAELDLRLEAASMDEMAQNFGDDPDIIIPKVDWGRTSKRVLTMSRISGIPIDDKAGMKKAKIDVDKVIETAGRLFFTSVFNHRFFHGDQHARKLNGQQTRSDCFCRFWHHGKDEPKGHLFSGGHAPFHY